MAATTQPLSPIDDAPLSSKYAFRELATFAIAVMVIGLFALYIFGFRVNGGPTLAPEQTGFIVGVLVNNFALAVAYYLGSSVGSAAKSAEIKKKP